MTLLLNIDVPDIAAGARFYTAAFGLTVGRRFGADFVELLGWPAPLYLLAEASGTVGAGDDRRRYELHWTPVHADIVVDDVDAAVERAVAAGAILEAPPPGHALWTHRDAGRPLRPRLLPAPVQRARLRCASAAIAPKEASRRTGRATIDGRRSFAVHNTPGALPRGVPVFLAQGSADTTIPPAITAGYKETLCRAGVAVRMVLLPGVDHRVAARSAAGDAIGWIGDRFAGTPPPSDC